MLPEPHKYDLQKEVENLLDLPGQKPAGVQQLENAERDIEAAAELTAADEALTSANGSPPRYQLIERFGAGGMRTVYRARRMEAAVSGKSLMVALLLKHGANRTILARDGRTAAQLALGNGWIEIAQSIDPNAHAVTASTQPRI